MKKTIEKIRKQFVNKLYRNESHIQFALVCKILTVLGWDVWNPAEVYTQFQVKKYPKEIMSDEEKGIVDIALFYNRKKSKNPEVFIETKAAGKLDEVLQKAQKQLHDYCHTLKPEIIVLTDGIRWLFYKPNESGSFEDQMFNDFNLLQDDIDVLSDIITNVLKKKYYPQKAIKYAKQLHNEFRKIKLIQSVKSEAISEARLNIKLTQYAIAQKLIKEKEDLNIRLNDIKALWDKQIATGQKTPAAPEQKLKGGKQIKTDVLKKYNNNDVKYAVINKNLKVKPKNWKELKKEVYNFIIKNNPQLAKKGIIQGGPKISKQKDDFKVAKSLDKGYYTEGRLSATGIVNHCHRALKAAGYDPEKDLIIGYVPRIKTRKNK